MQYFVQRVRKQLYPNRDSPNSHALRPGTPPTHQRPTYPQPQKLPLRPKEPRMNSQSAPHLSHVRAFGLALLTALVATFAQAQSDGTPPPPFNGIAHVAIRVHDLAASVAFYQKLGFEQAFDLKKDGVSYESFIKINDHQFIELYPVTETNPDVGFLHLCFEGPPLNAIYDAYISRRPTPTGLR